MVVSRVFLESNFCDIVCVCVDVGSEWLLLIGVGISVVGAVRTVIG